MPERQPPHQYGGQRYTTMTLSIPTIDIAPFGKLIPAIGKFPSYLAARLDGLKTARGLSEFEACGKYAELA